MIDLNKCKPFVDYERADSDVANTSGVNKISIDSYVQAATLIRKTFAFKLTEFNSNFHKFT